MAISAMWVSERRINKNHRRPAASSLRNTITGGHVPLLKLFSHQRFLAVYSGILTAAFVLTTGLNIWHGWIRSTHVSGAEQAEPRRVEFDQITVHRINIVEPEGTPRLVISDKAEYPGGFYMGKEFARSGRQTAGLLFMNDEGTENGGMIFGGYRSADGTLHSYGHLSFDEYQQDQTLSLDMAQDGAERKTVYQINDNASDTLLTPELIAAFSAVQAMPEGPEREKAFAALEAKYPIRLCARASLERVRDKSSALRLRDPEGHTRILLRVAADGTPAMQFFDAAGKVTHQWPEAPASAQQEKK